MRVIVSSCAKINLTLDILDKRQDGYHNIKTIMQSVDLCDTVYLTQNSSKRITVDCTNPKVPCDESNIVCKAARAFYKRLGRTCDGLHISIKKRIPTEAGLAGGSADGAAVLVGLNRGIFAEPFTSGELEQIGAEVGADVPFCIRGGTALAQGTGTTLTSLEDIPECYIVLVKPPVGVSTAKAYSAADSRAFIPDSSTDKMLPLLCDLKSIGKGLHNDFEEALSNDELLALKSDILKCDGSLGACMSGSGSTVFGIFEDKSSAESCAEIFKEKFTDVFVTTPIPFGSFVVSGLNRSINPAYSS